MEILRNIIALLLMLMTTFVIQSLAVVLCRSALYKVFPMVMFWVPLQCIVETVWLTGNLMEASPYFAVLLPMIAGDALGWVIGLRFRKILNAERAAGDISTEDDSGSE